jgi:poly-gamma-glutamate capsule biosynthesis protein CapA/YwtB (metallophosphatase superfamily)
MFLRCPPPALLIVALAVASAAAPPLAEAANPEATAPAAAAPPGGGAAPAAPRDELVLVVVGDVGLNRTNEKVAPQGAIDGAPAGKWAEMTPGIAPLINGDLNFMNLETVVTTRNDLAAGNKGQATPYLFRSHPIGVRHMLGLGFNLISAANNHAYDYGEGGVRETVANLRAMEKEQAGRMRFAGIGLDRDEAGRPVELTLDGGATRVAFGAIGIVTNSLDHHRAGAKKPGTVAYRVDDDWNFVTDRLKAMPADLRILSIHYGQERDIRTDDRQRREWRDAVRTRGVDVLVGHHAHVVRGVELNQGKLIFYGLGNFLIRGARDMNSLPELRVCCDYGLLSRVYLRRAADGRFAVRALEAYPLTEMHRVPRPLEPAEARKRVEVLNVLAETLDDKETGAAGVRFKVRDDGSGLHCVPGAVKDPGKVGALCAGYRGPSLASAEVRSRVRAAPDPLRPARKPALADRGNKRKKTARR